MSSIDQLVDLAVEGIRERFGEDLAIVTATALPRGADPFVGGERPMMIVGTRWAAVPPGGVLIGGGTAAMAAVLGFDLPTRDPAGETQPAAGANDDAAESAESGDEAETSDAEGASAAAPPAAGVTLPAISWNDRACAAARTHVTPVAVGLAHHLAERAGLPVDCAPSRVAITEIPRGEVGPISDGLVVVLEKDGYEIRLVVVAPAVLLARLQAPPISGEPAAPINGPMPRHAGSGGSVDPDGDVSPAHAIAHTLTEVPLDISLRVGRVHTPLHSVLALRTGDLLVLDQAANDPVELVAGTTRVASGEIETTEDGFLQFKVTSLAAERAPIPAVPPRTPHADVEPGGEPGSEPLTAIDGDAAA